MSNDAERLLGRAPRLTPIEPALGAAAGLDIDLSPGAFVRGEAALGQALTLAFVTLKGSDLFATEFGFSGLETIAAEHDPTLRRERLRLAVIDVLRREPRIRRIVSVKPPGESPAGSGASIDRRGLIEAEFETIAGARQVVQFQKEGPDVR
jgi:phage baseplate assembly protein W